MSYELPSLPYAYEALEPHISRRTMELHHNKHHRKYVDTLNHLIANTPYTGMAVDQIIDAVLARTVSKNGRFSTTPRSRGITRSFGTACRRKAAGYRRIR